MNNPAPKSALKKNKIVTKGLYTTYIPKHERQVVILKCGESHEDVRSTYTAQEAVL
jgi:hypothetical protein